MSTILTSQPCHQADYGYIAQPWRNVSVVLADYPHPKTVKQAVFCYTIIMSENEKKIEQLEKELETANIAKEKYRKAHLNAENKIRRLNEVKKTLSFHNLVHMKEVVRLQDHILELETKDYLSKLDREDLLKW